MDFLAKQGRFCRHSLPYVEKSNEVAAKRRIKILKDKIKTISYYFCASGGKLVYKPMLVASRTVHKTCT